MDPRLYTYERRTPRHNNPTFKSQFVNDSLHVFKGGPLDTSSLRKQKITQSEYRQSLDNSTLQYHPPDISKIRSAFENNRSKVPLSNLSSYGRQIMFPTQKGIETDFHQLKSNPQKFIKPQLYLDSKERNYVKTICKMNDQFLSRSRMNQSLDITGRDPAGKVSLINQDKRYYRYKHSHYDQVQHGQTQNGNSNSQISNPYGFNKPFRPSRLNYADEMKGIL